MEIPLLEYYDGLLFSLFRNEFSLQYKDKFINEKLYNSWGRKCNFIINFLKNLSKELKQDCIKNSINIYLGFITDKEKKYDLKYLSSFENDTFIHFNEKMLLFRNKISTFFFKLILKYKNQTKFEEENPIMSTIGQAIENYLNGEFNFLKDVFDLLKYCLDLNVNIYEEFLLLLNSDDIIINIIRNKKCTLNSNQIKFIKNQKIELGKPITFFDELKSINISNDEFLNEYNEIKSNFKIKKTSKKKSKVDIQNYINPSKEKEKAFISENNNTNNKGEMMNKIIEEDNNTDNLNVNEKILEDTNTTISNINKDENLEDSDPLEKNKVMKIQIEKIQKENRKLKQENQKLKQKIQKLEQENQKLKEEKPKVEHKIEKLEKNLDKEKKERKQEIKIMYDNLKNKIDICESNIPLFH